MIRQLRQAILFTLVTMLLLGGAYPLLFRLATRTACPELALGSLVRRPDGSIAGSRLIAQKFTRPEYFLARPSGVDYDASSAGGTNDGPSNPDHLKAVRERLEATEQREGVEARQVPSEMVTASGSGLGPDIPPAGAEMQAARVAAARQVPVERIRDLVRQHTEPALFGILGRPRVNVLELNLDLDASLGAPAAGGPR